MSDIGDDVAVFGVFDDCHLVGGFKLFVQLFFFGKFCIILRISCLLPAESDVRGISLIVFFEPPAMVVVAVAAFFIRAFSTSSLMKKAAPTTYKSI